MIETGRSSTTHKDPTRLLADWRRPVYATLDRANPACFTRGTQGLRSAGLDRNLIARKTRTGSTSKRPGSGDGSPCRTSTCRSFDAVSSGLSRFPTIADRPTCGTNLSRFVDDFQGATPRPPVLLSSKRKLEPSLKTICLRTATSKSVSKSADIRRHSAITGIPISQIQPNTSIADIGHERRSRAVTVHR